MSWTKFNKDATITVEIHYVDSFPSRPDSRPPNQYEIATRVFARLRGNTTKLITAAQADLNKATDLLTMTESLRNTHTSPAMGAPQKPEEFDADVFWATRRAFNAIGVLGATSKQH